MTILVEMKSKFKFVDIFKYLFHGKISGDSTSTEEQNKFSKVIASNPLSANPTKWSKTPKQIVGFC